MAIAIEEALPLLRRPFAPAAVRVKVQAQERGPAPSWGQVVRYVDARLVCERLNLVPAAPGATSSSRLTPRVTPCRDDGEPAHGPVYVVCRLTVLGQTHADVGEGRDPKAAVSDAIKRAAVPFGIARSIYAVPRRFMFSDDAKRPPRDKLRRRGDRLHLTDDNEELLRDEYAEWLEQVGIDAFGPPLDHGPDAAADDGDPPGDAESPAPAGPEPAATRGVGRARGGLRAVAAAAPAVAPATIRERVPLEAAIETAGFERDTVGRLARLLLGEGLLDRLTPAQVAELADLLGRAAGRAITQAALARTLEAAEEDGRDRKDAARTVRAWLTEAPATPRARRAAEVRR